MSFASLVKKFLVKELLVEKRTFLFISSLFFYNIVLISLIQIALGTAMLSPLQHKKLAPLFIWLIYLLSTIMSFQNIFTAETEQDAVKALLARRFSLRALYTAKFLFIFFLSTFSFYFLVLLYTIFTKITPFSFINLALCSLLISAGSTALGILLVAVSYTLRASAVILPLLWLALGAPFYTVSLELLYLAYLPSSSGFSYWLFFEILFVLMYLVLGVILSPYVIEGLAVNNEK
ncbi:MAG: hypothetical protein D6780_02730 [Candidatus Dadabacteria bacterium]|nr:MAG: hypothetical protein D6780_02730 [Candidatus Dadabacteria bacterium]